MGRLKFDFHTGRGVLRAPLGRAAAPLVVGRAAPPPHVALDAEPEAPPDAHLVSFADLRVSDVVVVAVVRAAAGRG